MEKANESGTDASFGSPAAVLEGSCHPPVRAFDVTGVVFSLGRLKASRSLGSNVYSADLGAVVRPVAAVGAVPDPMAKVPVRPNVDLPLAFLRFVGSIL